MHSKEEGEKGKRPENGVGEKTVQIENKTG